MAKGDRYYEVADLIFEGQGFVRSGNEPADIHYEGEGFRRV